MRAIIQGKAANITVDTVLLLKSGEPVRVIADLDSHLVAVDGDGNNVEVHVRDIERIIEEVVQTITFLAKVFKFIGRLFGRS